MIKKLYDRCVELARHKFSKPILGFVSFIESSFFPIPPDVMIVPMVVAKRNEFILIASVATIFSALGALFGYLIGVLFFNEIGIKIFELYGYDNVNFLKEKFSESKSMLPYIVTLFIAGFTPVPFKLLTITSGFVQFNLVIFLITCIITRGLRFFLVAYLTNRFGKAFGPFLEKRGAKFSAILGILIILIALIFYFIIKKYV
ncbi:MAG: hypothetical protein CL687_05170 [Candidatus Pelagibacter sp.]|nr:hypothetical protein [Candidatus Pelagibacter sp.]MAJ86326.1 hypothetical protein [Candidatus Pelagibacter sp.]OUW23245.1 MAG: hypothetical protein CBD34_03535 [Rickettsiales bacterium TMED174]OUW23435.1 MAG: hypothetical protein CBD34_03140 [Rickettsiales bacterium TMED174]|tara:strand:- start:1335 stop:1940 length:606 start_codon:yes stop_codon:yes gene_type:complete